MLNDVDTPVIDFQKNIEAIRNKRIEEHQQKIAELKTSLGKGFNLTSQHPLNLLADGDSWFDYFEKDVIAQLPILNNRINFQPPLNLSVAGDATSNSLGVARQTRITQALTDSKNGKFDAILFSGGGNDIAGEQFCLWLNNSKDVNGDYSKALKEDVFKKMLDIIESAYLNLIELRNNCRQDIPIFIHSYDFPPPNNKGVCKLAGPWLYPSLKYREWNDFTKNSELVKSMLLKLNQRLETIAANPENKMILVKTQGTLLFTDANDDRDWANELHPTHSGFNKIAQKFLTALKKEFPSRLPT